MKREEDKGKGRQRREKIPVRIGTQEEKKRQSSVLFFRKRRVMGMPRTYMVKGKEERVTER
jgi:hypothetical protein